MTLLKTLLLVFVSLPLVYLGTGIAYLGIFIVHGHKEAREAVSKIM